MSRVHSRGMRGCDRGQALVEFALASFIFFMTIFGILSGGLMVWQYNMMANLAQEGARWAAVRGSGGGEQASAAQVQAYVWDRSLGLKPTVTTTSVADPANCRDVPSSSTSCACTTTSVEPSTLTAGERVCVKVTKPFVPFTRFIGIGALTLQSTAQMTIAR
jgi:Flp pilus assembly protein TadG